MAKTENGSSLPGSPEPRLGAALRALRAERGWTLAELSGRTGLSISTLSKVERDKISLTYDKLLQVTRGTGADIAELFAAPGAPTAPAARRSINRIGAGRQLLTPAYDYWYLSTDLVRKQFIPMLGRPLATSLEEFGELVRHEGEEFVFVLDGAIEVHTEDYAPFVLRRGESCYLDSTMGHAYLRRGRGRCQVLAVCSAGNDALMRALSGRRQLSTKRHQISEPGRLTRRTAARRGSNIEREVDRK
ncbi:MAG: helix-turn-helix domain-containing protein [Gemmatimonadales bacterium]